MIELSYSFHVSNQQNAIKSLSNLSRSENHNGRLYDDYDTRKAENEIYNNIDRAENIFLAGDKNLVKAIKRIYDKEFSTAVKEYNEKQNKPSRQIKNYLNKIDKSQNQHVATEIIIQVGTQKERKNVPIEERKNVIPIYKNQLQKFKNDYQNFKIAQAVIHMDENSPHLHIIGVPVGESQTGRGLSRKVQKSAVFNQKNLYKIQEDQRNLALRDCQKYLSSDIIFSEKKKGRNKDYYKDDYVELQKSIQDKEQELNVLDEKVKNLHQEISHLIGKNSKNLSPKIAEIDIPNLAKPFLNNNILISPDEKKRVEELLKLTLLISRELNSSKEKLEYLENENKHLKKSINSIEQNNLNTILKGKNNLKTEIKTQFQDEIDKIKKENYEIKKLYQPETVDLITKENLSLKNDMKILEEDHIFLLNQISEIQEKNQNLQQELKKYKREKTRNNFKDFDDDFSY